MNFKGDTQSDFDNRFNNGQYDQDRGSSYYKKDGLQNHLGNRQDRNDTQISNFINTRAFDDGSDYGSFNKKDSHRNSTFVNNNAFNDDEEDDDNTQRSKGNAIQNRNDSD